MERRKVIIDCDPGIDDSLAIMMALKSEEMEVLGITIVCGNAPVKWSYCKFGGAHIYYAYRAEDALELGDQAPVPALELVRIKNS